MTLPQNQPAGTTGDYLQRALAAIAVDPANAAALKQATILAAVAQNPRSSAWGQSRFFGPIWTATENEARAFHALERRLAAETREWALPVEDLIKDSDVLLLGESHGTPSSIETLAAALPRLKDSGVRVVGLESSLEAQALFDDRSLSPRSTMRTAAYAKLYDAAKRLDMKILMLDVPNQSLARQAVRWAAEATGEPVASFPTSLAQITNLAMGGYRAGVNEAVGRAVFQWRESFWADRLADAMDGGKAVALVGDGHLAHPPGTAPLDPSSTYFLGRRQDNFATQLGVWGLKAFSTSLVGGSFDDVAAAAIDAFSRYFLHRLAQDPKDESSRGFVRTSSSSGVYHMPSAPK